MAKKEYRRESEKKAQFLDAFAQLGTITHAAKAVNVDVTSHYHWLEHPKYGETYRRDFRIAEEAAHDVLIREGRRRSVEGYVKPVFHKGVACGAVVEYSNALLMRLIELKYRKRELDIMQEQQVSRQDMDAVRKEVQDNEEFIEFLRNRGVAKVGTIQSSNGNGNGHARTVG